MPRLAVTIAAVGAAAAAVLVWGEVVHWRSSRRRLGGQPAPGGRAKQWSYSASKTAPTVRTSSTAIESARESGPRVRTSQSPASQRPTSQGVLVLSGGSVGGPIPEAEGDGALCA